MAWAMKKAKHPPPKRWGVRKFSRPRHCRSRAAVPLGRPPTQSPWGDLLQFVPMSTTSSPRFHALVPCAGSGSRAGTAQPKQYQDVAGQPMVMHTLLALASVLGAVVAVVVNKVWR